MALQTADLPPPRPASLESRAARSLPPTAKTAAAKRVVLSTIVAMAAKTTNTRVATGTVLLNSRSPRWAKI